MKKKYINNTSSAGSGASAVQARMQGVLAFCHRNKEAQATKELMALLDEYAELLFPPKSANAALRNQARNAADIGENAIARDCANELGSNNNDNDDDDDDDDDEGLDVEAAFAKEVATLNKPRSAKRFAWLSVGIDCCLFVNPTALVTAIMSDLSASGKQKSRYLQRIIPATETCPAYPRDILAMASRVLAPHFFATDGEPIKPKKFSIVFARRNNSSVSRDELIPQIAAIVTATTLHTVDITNPDVCVLVEVFKAVCAMAVVENYYLFKKFNLESLYGKLPPAQKTKQPPVHRPQKTTTVPPAAHAHDVTAENSGASDARQTPEEHGGATADADRDAKSKKRRKRGVGNHVSGDYRKKRAGRSPIDRDRGTAGVRAVVAAADDE
ncbi:hypothetical protein HDU83_007184 [Entophlyctis luteolus]|nr:hypothetical protein HDU83_007184 [Entophlyctis luteolus]